MYRMHKDCIIEKELLFNIFYETYNKENVDIQDLVWKSPDSEPM